ncbi:MAG TPA: cytochrome c [Candidatus Acidoferrales bacterium]|nr:cytochrome c [Candidatus Acidoferrales bacterium]
MKLGLMRVALVVFLVFAMLLLVLPASRAEDAAGLYKSKCAMCHGPDGSGNTPTGKAMKVTDLRSEEVQKKSDAQLIEITTNGKAKMPAFKGKLTEPQIKELVGYIRELAKKK